MGKSIASQKKELEKRYKEYHLKDITTDMFRAMDDPNFSVALIYDKLEKVKDCLTAKEYMDILLKLHKIKHGEKIQLDITKTEIKGYCLIGPESFPKKVIDVEIDNS